MGLWYTYTLLPKLTELNIDVTKNFRTFDDAHKINEFGGGKVYIRRTFIPKTDRPKGRLRGRGLYHGPGMSQELSTSYL